MLRPGGLRPGPLGRGHPAPREKQRHHGARDPGGQRDGHGQGGKNPWEVVENMVNTW